MRMTTLGTSHGNHTYCRFHSSTLFEAGGASYLVDAGEPVTGLMIRAARSLDCLRAVFITHLHDDHVNGLPSLIKMLVKYPRPDKHCDIFLPEAAAIPALEEWLQAVHIPWPADGVTLHAVGAGSVYEDDVLQATAEPTAHLRDPAAPDTPLSFSYTLETEGARIVCTGDLRGDFADFPLAAREAPCDVCLCEATHYRPEVSIPILRASPIGRLVLTHVHDPWHGAGELDLLAIMGELPYPVSVAHDGDTFEL